MNCKQGDLAIIVRSFLGQEGRIVRCVELFEHPNWPREPCWKTDVALKKGFWCHDDQLRPIRGMFGTDETLTWADVPRKEHA